MKNIENICMLTYISTYCPTIFVLSKAHDMSYFHTKDFRFKETFLTKCFSSASKGTVTCAYNNSRSNINKQQYSLDRSKTLSRRRKRKATITTIAKLFALHANAKMYDVCENVDFFFSAFSTVYSYLMSDHTRDPTFCVF